MSAKEEEKKAQDLANTTKSDEQKPIPNSKVMETFNKPDIKEIALDKELNLFGDTKWTIWENIDFVADKQVRGSKDENYADKLRKVAWFDNLI